MLGAADFAGFFGSSKIGITMGSATSIGAIALATMITPSSSKSSSTDRLIFLPSSSSS